VLLVEAGLLPVVIPAGFRLLGVSRTQAWLRRWTLFPAAGFQVRRDSREAILLARQAQRVVKRKLGIQGPCLVRSLTLWTLLLRRGVETELRVGVRKRNGKVEAHAWVEFQGVPVNENESVVGSYEVYPLPLAFDEWGELSG